MPNLRYSKTSERMLGAELTGVSPGALAAPAGSDWACA